MQIVPDVQRKKFKINQKKYFKKYGLTLVIFADCTIYRYITQAQDILDLSHVFGLHSHEYVMI